jgi:hypothetical protein
MVRLRPNHYELLGLSPTATPEEIEQAFARELRLPRAFGSLAEFTVAYETLRDPIKRKAYDASIARKPEPSPALSLAGRLEGAALGATSPKPVVHLKPSAPTPPIARFRARAESRPQARTAPSATALLHQPITARLPQRDPIPPAGQRPRHAKAMARPGPEPRQVHDEELRPPVPDEARHERYSPFQWKLPALAAGALVLAVGGGAWMGVESGNDASQDQLKPAVTLKVPRAKAAAPVVASPEEAANFAEEQPPVPTRTVAPARKEAARPPLQIDLPDEQPAELAALEEQQRAIAAEDVATASPAVAATSAKLPLPNSVIARTIGRIGYPCGQVASTAAVDGAAGVFTVTCTSGHSYRAAPVRGRYHFRRMGKS